MLLQVGGDHFGHVIAHLHCRLSNAGNLVAVLLEVGQVAKDEDIRHGGGIECGVDRNAAALVQLHAQQLAQRRGLHPGSPERNHGVHLFAADFHPSGAKVVHVGLGMNFDAESRKRSLGLGGQVGGISGKDARRALQQQHAGFPGIDVPKVAAHVELGNIADGACQFHAGRSSADNDKIQRRMPTVLDHLPLGQLEGQQHAAANLQSIFNGLEARSQRRPLILAEVGMSRAGGEHQVVPPYARARAERDCASGDVEGHHFVHQHFGISLAAHNAADWLGNVCRRQHGKRDLVKERLKRVVVAAVDYGNVDGQMRQSFGGVNAGKARADNDDAGPSRCLEGFDGIAQAEAPLCSRCARGGKESEEDCFQVETG